MSEIKTVLECRNLRVSFSEPGLSVDVLRGISLSIQQGQSISIVGASGSGKSTLLHTLGGLMAPTAGEVSLAGHALNGLSARRIGEVRNRHLGFVYQFHHLLPEFSALENVAMPLLIRGTTVQSAKEQATAMLERVGLSHRIRHKPSELSGGERQRAAVARALATNPDCILADEPTGNLDQKTAGQLQELLLELVRGERLAMVVATHDLGFARRLSGQYELRDGKLTAAGA
ncbi:MAG: lipoprotein-releasing ABC transporter ATP-binding protein LolD [Arenicellales bacterium]|jgi:lipoprotein-releasing system ATP-binding protein|nr:lipoprotein-releasing ABC transporter ATP-binding protein LolD [Arenicellales bacterium]MDP6791777.1 lipoprotein-releasing ABC transporter ATP-binding protein LolD [Arenicellales bacterium]MDP6918570.1 lipoprotein-releasing ABC transporter ATP-binding protein LolD [Arenicellales bacterium]|tara:strand:+ start:22765 stop:23457 length:693 start_codon:yes stop_codon:yes gene_type:complete